MRRAFPLSAVTRTLPLLSGIAFASMSSIRLADSMLPRLAETFHTTSTDTAWVITGPSCSCACTSSMPLPSHTATRR